MTKRTMSRLRGMLKGRAKPTSSKATPSSGPKPGSNTVNHQGMIKEGARTAPSKTLHKAQTTPSRKSTPSTDTGMPKAQTAPNRRAEAKKALEAARGKRGAMRKKDAKQPTKGAPPKATATPRKAPPKSTNKPIRHTRGMARGFAALKNKDK